MNAFDALDRNGDGVLTRAEFNAAMGGAGAPQQAVTYAAAPQPMPMPAVQYATAAPMTYAAPAPASFVPPPAQFAAPVTYAAGGAFNALDANGDGVISRQEFAQSMAPPVQYGAPVTLTAPSVTYAAPAPASYVPAPAPVTLAAPAPAQAFNAFDANGDGVITRQEFAQATAPPVQYGAPVTYTAPSVTYAAPAPASYVPAPAPAPMTYAAPSAAPVSAFNALDANHDGVITRQEFAQAMAAPVTYSAPAQVVQSYAAPAPASYVPAPAPVVQTYAAPAAPAGVLSREEFESMKRQVSYVPAPQMSYAAPTAFNAIDANHDGVITRQEFAQAMQAPAVMVQTSPASFVPPPVTYAAPAVSYAAPVQQPVTYGAPVTAFDRLDANHDGVITRQEFAAAAAPAVSYAAPVQQPVTYGAPVTAFDRLDANHDGIITRQEFAAAAAPAVTYATPAPAPVTYAAPAQPSYAAPVQYSAPLAQNPFDRLDANHDGIITRQEFAAAAAPAVTYAAPAPAPVTYAAPAQPSYAAPVQYSAPLAQNPFDRLDANHDGVITRQEFAAVNYSAPVQQPISYGAPAARPGYAQVIGGGISAFDRMDANGDGVITMQEFANLQGAPMTTYGAPQPFLG
eukprot:TRINITY_DN12733_c1_g1_i2.p1 TRINITY_DN12733_c1_g1~~TRINITY_DN12733_c1_g1_i2.p1  ORF type:complete len:625 (-),score=176.09 TRINITY_DN12733_c1_g1_i2:557-2431(-)